MKFPWPTIIVLVVVAAGSRLYVAQEIRSLEGVVLEAETNRPLEGVKVSASTTGFLVSGLTDPNGRFKIAASKPGRYNVVPVLKGYVYSRPAHIKTGREAGIWVQIADGRPVPPLELRMVKPGSIVGKVLTATGDTLPGGIASVSLAQYTYNSSGQRTLSNVPGLHFAYEGSFVRMDDRGDYRFYDVPPGNYYLRVSSAGAFGGEGSMYFPGTPDENRAQTVQVKPGEELRINTFALPPQRSTTVRLHFPNPAEFQFFQYTMLHSGRGSIMGSRRSVDGEDEIKLPFAPGHHDLFVGATPLGPLTGRPAIDALFGTISLDVGDSPIDRQVVMSPGLRVNGAATLVNEAGVRSPVALFPPGGGLMCRFISDADPSRVIGGSVCFGMQFPAGQYRLELGELPTDQYVQSATIGGRDVLAEGIQLQGDVDLQIVLATPGAILEGIVKDAAGEKLSDAVVVLVPDPPYRRTGGPLYRSTISDLSGNFELRGIAPGNYHLFAWLDLEGAAYRNAEFMKKYEDAGKAIRIEKGSRSVTEVTSSASP
jgi:hypothetical protein